MNVCESIPQLNAPVEIDNSVGSWINISVIFDVEVEYWGFGIFIVYIAF